MYFLYLIFELTCKIRFLNVNIQFVVSFTVLIGFVLRIWSLTVENVKYKKYIIIITRGQRSIKEDSGFFICSLRLSFRGRGKFLDG